MKADFSFNGRGATKSFRIINDTEEKIKIEAEVLTRQISLNNKEKREDTNDFTLYPPQMEVEPGKSKVMRVSYIGEKSDFEKAYRLIVRQFPNSKKPNKAGAQINILFEYVASLYVAPKGVTPKLKVENAFKSGSQIILNFQNTGTQHTLLKSYNLELKQGKKSRLITFKELDYKELATQNILSGIKRKLVLGDSVFEAGKIKARFIKK